MADGEEEPKKKVRKTLPRPRRPDAVDKAKLGRSLLGMRERIGLSQAALGKKIGRGQSYVAVHESGEGGEMSLRDWLNWCDACECDPRWSLDDAGFDRRRRRASDAMGMPDELYMEDGGGTDGESGPGPDIADAPPAADDAKPDDTTPALPPA